MAPQPVYPSPTHQLGSLMVDARRRGLSFEAFWSAAMNEGGSIVMVTDETPPPFAVRWPTDAKERSAWRRAIATTRDAWARSYSREAPTAGDAAIVALAQSLGLTAEAQLDSDMAAVSGGSRSNMWRPPLAAA